MAGRKIQIEFTNADGTHDGSNTIIAGIVEKLGELAHDCNIIKSCDITIRYDTGETYETRLGKADIKETVDEPTVIGQGVPQFPTIGYLPLVQYLYRSGTIKCAGNKNVYRNKPHRYTGFIDPEHGTAWLDAHKLEYILINKCSTFNVNEFNKEMLAFDAVVWQRHGSPVCETPDLKGDKFIVFYLDKLKPVGGVCL